MYSLYKVYPKNSRHFALLFILYLLFIEISGVDKIDDTFKKVTPQVGPQQQSKNAKRRAIKKSRRETQQQDRSIHGQTTQQQDAGDFEDTIDPSYQQKLEETRQELEKSHCSVLKEQQQQIEEYQKEFELLKLKHQNDQQTMQIQQQVIEQKDSILMVSEVGAMDGYDDVQDSIIQDIIDEVHMVYDPVHISKTIRNLMIQNAKSSH
ncbi:hypothetical protein DFA_11791 [Cavenderia fasciculata]|uniref:Uncharacterized protein n=1 Tax=Cavenderia fasciculata TaxID=261658 RepID=F4QE81_CACFS|nr:uncharacterized protein DFA_11791 [Cavenderia fasciculata]EGG14028.1 hypothetical protein DFA_11791 [Cavenderia fasciculata]|eukprot:XP_004350736.1 hypothetical protein DFA_11791 [Cavenderia fasciculata]